MRIINLARLMRLIARLGVLGLTLSVLHRFVGDRIACAFPRVTKRAVKALLNEPGDGRPFIMIATLDWFFPYKQRLHHLAAALADKDWKVIFISPSAGYDRFFFQRRPRRNVLVSKNLGAVLDCIVAPVVYFISADSRFDMRLFEDIDRRQGRIVYDYLDVLDEKVANGPIMPSRLKLHDALLADEERCSVIASAVEILRDVKLKRSRHFALVTNGVDTAHFHVKRSTQRLRDDFGAILDRRRKIAGYYGALASWLDYELLLKLAREATDVDVVLIGPDYDGSLAVLSNRPANLHILPSIPYDDLPHHAAWFDVALIPFVKNELTEGTSPLKMFEYMALGLPIVSTDIAEAKRYKSVHSEPNHEHFVHRVRQLINGCESNTDTETALEEARTNDWRSKVQQIEALILEA